ncbi:MAG: polysaccharide deacetylase family protein [Desulfobacteraceae bacterium]|nr:polysaccharide deacetylase family protein [Desulfobacteraceae bacterium]
MHKNDWLYVPVVMYHSVGRINPDWIWNFLTVPFGVFADQIDTLYRKGYHTIDLEQLHGYVREGKTIPEKSIVLTFDDGYLDNWVYVFPLLKKYGFKATIFVSGEFVDPNPQPRPTMEDVWRGNITEEELNFFGFLSWEEMRLMEQSGLVDIQSHAMSHTWYFCKDEIVDFRHPGDGYIWMDWNNAPEVKYKYLKNNERKSSQYGAPVYVHQKSLAGRRIFPSLLLDKLLTEYVIENGGERFFQKSAWRDILFKEASALRQKHKVAAKIETDNEMDQRFHYEIVESKKTIEKRLNKRAEFLCWPGGGICQAAIDKAAKHYKAFTIPSSLSVRNKNTYGENPLYIRRFGVPYLHDENPQYLNGNYLHWVFKEYQGRKIARKIRQGLKLIHLAKNHSR